MQQECMLMRNRKWRILIGVLVVAAVVAVISILNGGVADFHEKYEGTDLTTDVQGIGRDDTYEYYLKQHAEAVRGQQEIALDLAAFEGDGQLQDLV